MEVESELLISPVALDLHQRRGDPWWFRMMIFRRGFSKLDYISSHSIAGQECFPVWAELRREGGLLFVMRLRSVDISYGRTKLAKMH